MIRKYFISTLLIYVLEYTYIVLFTIWIFFVVFPSVWHIIYWYN